MKKRKKKSYLYFIAPGFLAYTIFIILPIFYVIYLSVFKWSGLGDKLFVGLDNFRTLFFNQRMAPIFWNAIKNNLKYLLCVWFIITPFQFLVAYLFYIKIPFYKYYKFMIFMPYVISSTIVSFFCTMIFNPTIGFLNNFFEKAGLNRLVGAWIGDPNLSFKILILIVIWQGAASGMMIFYANMLDIPQDVIDACRIDGASSLQQLTRILIPLSLPACSSIIVMSSIWALGIFDLPFMLGGPNGGINGTLDFVNLVFYRYTFGSVLSGEINLGFGASISVTMFVIIMIVTFIQNKFLSKFEYDN